MNTSLLRTSTKFKELIKDSVNSYSITITEVFVYIPPDSVITFDRVVWPHLTGQCDHICPGSVTTFICTGSVTTFDRTYNYRMWVWLMVNTFVLTVRSLDRSIRTRTVETCVDLLKWTIFKLKLCHVPYSTGSWTTIKLTEL